MTDAKHSFSSSTVRLYWRCDKEVQNIHCLFWILVSFENSLAILHVFWKEHNPVSKGPKAKCKQDITVFLKICILTGELDQSGGVSVREIEQKKPTETRENQVGVMVLCVKNKQQKPVLND